MFATVKELPLNNYRLLGKTGLRISPLGIGAMNFGAAKGWESVGSGSKEECFQILDEYVANGGNFIDTADGYHNGKSEEWIGEWMKLRGNRDQIVLATKYTFNTKPGNVNAGGAHRKHMHAAVEASLSRLQTTFIDLYYVHFYDHTTPLDEALSGLQDLVHAGKVLYLGVSDHPAWMVARANAMAELRGWSPFVAYQGLYSLIDRDLEREIVPMCRELHLGVIPWGAIGSGKLTGKYTRDHKPSSEQAPRSGSPFFTPITEREYKVIDAVAAIAKELNSSCSQVALAWMLKNAAIPSVLIGSRTLEQFRDNMGAVAVAAKLTEEHVKKLNEVSFVDPGFPHTMLGTNPNTSIANRAGGRIALPPY